VTFGDSKGARYEHGNTASGNHSYSPEAAHIDYFGLAPQSPLIQKTSERFMDELGQFSVVFHSMEPSDAIRQRAETLLQKLAHLTPDIMRGKMVIESRHRHHHQGNVYHVAIRLHLPGLDIEVSHDPELNHAHEDVYVAMRDACDAAKRQLKAHEARRSGKAARHERERFNNRPEQQPE
jgi:ribosome-associated translation inhibitor RaiA